MSKRVVVLGGGISGYGSAILAQKEGFEVLLSDSGRIADMYKARLDEWNVRYEEGGHSEEYILGADEVIKSPGIPDKAPIVQKIRTKGIPVISEMEFAKRYSTARTVCITGSNGKTTTTSLIYKILQDAGVNVGLGGNIGESYAYQVATAEFDWYVLELSSFQLDGMFDFGADVGVLMNITPDHLDRYDYKFENYAASKLRITQNQTADDQFIYMADDAVIAEQMTQRTINARRLPFSKCDAQSEGAWIDGEMIRIKALGKEFTIDTRRMQIKGIHNCYNAMAAAMAAVAVGVEPEKIVASIESFGGVEHRLERAGVIDDVEYINDSKATNVDSVWYALESMTKPLVWIAGGTDKGNDYAPLVEFARAKIHTLVCMGLDNAKLVESFTGIIPNIISTSSLDEAMTAARNAAHSGDAVLLSPACASFDLFKNYEHRGEMFKQWVANHQK
ncbi:MAG: UDP-N-acetylmuramoyl-L-alanine--D-glutamate ligase [Rikenellaceae bacterium]|nr:UDP-N-acetylmuramoyl-L-alanine--D-glutamate ligase [Rikenellaceae bacterium]